MLTLTESVDKSWSDVIQVKSDKQHFVAEYSVQFWTSEANLEC